MTSLSIRKLDPAVKERLRLRAARHGHSMEEEARQILSETCGPEGEPQNAFEALRRPPSASAGLISSCRNAGPVASRRASTDVCEAAASAYADIRIARERAGRPVAREDGMIAAITKTAGATVVTRDEIGFAGCGVPIITPWVRGS